MSRVRFLVHALDRTGPPMLALTAIRSLRVLRPRIDIDVVAFRGGPMVDDLPDEVPVRVLLRPSEAWDHRRPDPRRSAEVRAAVADLPRADATVLVSIAAGQCLPSLPDTGEPTAAWVVESGEDLHWLDDPIGLSERVDRWWPGSAGTRVELLARPGFDAPPTDLDVLVEFVEERPGVSPDRLAAVRDRLGVAPGELLVMGAGIATVRKAPDLFLEVALRWRRSGAPPAAFVWIGGADDPLFDPLVGEAERLGLDRLRFVPSVPDVHPWFAAADLFVHPARLDAFPLVALHAALAGTPVIGFAGAVGLTEMFGEAFVGAPYPDVGGLVGRAAALADPGRRSAVVEAQAAAARRFTSSVAGPDLARRVDELLAMPAPRARRSPAEVR